MNLNSKSQNKPTEIWGYKWRKTRLTSNKKIMLILSKKVGNHKIETYHTYGSSLKI